MTKKRLGIVRFPGTNCDADVWQAAIDVGLEPNYLWHADHFEPAGYSGFVLPGGFSYGDYLRCGALAAKSAAMADLKKAAEQGRPVLGICNGFQILCESGLLPGALVRNREQRFIDKWVELRLVNSSPFFGPKHKGVEIRLPVAHGEGNYQADSETIKNLEDNGQIWWCYRQDVNGSVSQIAGVLNSKKNVAGLMPHPERAMLEWMGGEDGWSFFKNLT